MQLAIGTLSWLHFRQVKKLLCQVLNSKEIITYTLINLQVADVDFDVLASCFALVKDVAQCSRDESSIFVAARASSHRKSFSGPCLTIGKYSAIKTFKGRIYNIFGYSIKNLFLFGVHIEDLIELKRTFLFFVIDIALFLILGDVEFRAVLLFVDGFVTKKVLNPLKVFLCGRTLNMI